ncbi:16S rRNA (guanine(527)-N(7))-methyltransferase RsmG [Seohaeicola zhoushanensis]|uniref:Ribosomal RNA small subunit methyltransferase G n=1 Tax=Seohaeicola zhoushanensis TaxID=1569283 RepID=A0A8J3M3U9_9RHOB|nr:16S rRNA (guanine(527)-N(7))-methyltransferase RsmG [Seohaeicola zhoushanensis]GHF35395.1 ribosomal RNA small subunit methyltransferase G [Seohaeicola zhoushanensis]
MVGDGAPRNVSRETSERLDIYESLLIKWNPKINLVSRNSLAELRSRHFADSLQIYDLAPPEGHWCDLGSGGGFPGLIVAIRAAEAPNPRPVTLIESDQRKAAFLRTAAREMGVACKVLSERIELAEPQNAQVLSARALAELSVLLGFAERHLAPEGLALFPKGASWKKEVDNARREWSFDCQPITSETEPAAAILSIKGVSRV